MINSSIIKEQGNDYVVLSKSLLDWYEDTNQDKVMVMWNESDYIVHCSSNIVQFTGQAPELLMEQKWTILFTKEEQLKINQHFSSSIDRCSLRNVQLINQHNQEFTFHVTIDRIKIDQEIIYIGQLKMNTYIQQLERMVVESEKLVLAAQLSAGLVHEIRNPLTSLKGFLQLIQSGIQQKNEYYHVMIGEIDKLERITTELLQIAKPFKQQMKQESIQTLLDEVTFMMNTQSNMRDVNLEIHCEGDLTTDCNAAQMKQVFLNLIINGAEAMQRKGTIYIHAYQLDNYVVIDVIDEGDGVTPEIIQELKEPFFTTKEKGTGLGLVITQHLLDLHDATLTVKANAECGSTFTIRLPIINKN